MAMPSAILKRLLLLPGAILALSLSHALAHGLEPRKAESSTSPAPISIAPSGLWDGVDGAWSSFALKVGTPPQDIRTFVSWSVYQTWAVLPDGCQDAADLEACAQVRGGEYNETASTSFDEQGIYDLSVGRTLGLYSNAIFGYDTVTVEQNDGHRLTVQNTTVGGMAFPDFYLGVFGINPRPTNFTSIKDPSPSYMELLKEQEYIPSLSFGYTAGAPYRSTTSYASLTLGGYDSSKLIENSISWTFGPNPDRDIVVAVQSIHTPSRDPSSPIATELLPSPILAYLDALVPEIWLPIPACEYFEYEFGLVYDNVTELYIVNETLHQSLLERNASITFDLGIHLDRGTPVSIELPYSAFDLTAKSPYAGFAKPTYYFPLRRAANESQYFIGRTFFQEAYISVDYERQVFNVSQRNWDSSADTRLVAIPPADASSGSSSSLSAGAIAGIVVGVVAVIAIIAILLILRHRRNKRKVDHGEKLPSETGSSNNISPSRRGTHENVFPKAELEGSAPSEDPPLASGALSQDSSGSAPITPRSPNHLSGATFIGPRTNSSSYSPVTESPEEGSGTHSSTDTSTGTSRGTGYGTASGTMRSLVSPVSPPDTSEYPEADSRELTIHEMAGDMPTRQEKDGKALSEKEAMAYREMVYNGVESPVEPSPTVKNFSRASLQGPRRVNPEEVTTSVTVIDSLHEPRDLSRHQKFSFELDRNENSSEELYE